MLKENRQKYKLSQKILAEKVGICRNYLSKLENKEETRHRASAILIKNLSTELKIDSETLFLYFIK